MQPSLSLSLSGQWKGLSRIISHIKAEVREAKNEWKNVFNIDSHAGSSTLGRTVESINEGPRKRTLSLKICRTSDLASSARSLLLPRVATSADGFTLPACLDAERWEVGRKTPTRRRGRRRQGRPCEDRMLLEHSRKVALGFSDGHMLRFSHLMMASVCFLLLCVSRSVSTNSPNKG